MNVKLVSEDRELFKRCREILAEVRGQNWHFSTTSLEEADSQSDLLLWDFHAGMPLPEIPSGSSRHLFLVHREDLSELRERIPGVNANILLKPVTRATLTAFLGLAASASGDRISTTNSIRADRDDMLQCLIQTNLKLQEHDQDRTTFLARAVHDFRAPLTAVSGYCGLLISEPLGPVTENQKEVLRRMQHSATRLSRMATAMFELSVGRHVKRRPDLKHGDLRACLEQVLHEITPFADDKRIAIAVDLAPCDRPLYFEAGQIKQVLINILDNACKFTPKAGSIDIRGYPYFWERRATQTTVSPGAERRQRSLYEPNSYRLDIRDSGMEIPSELLNSIFEEYTSYSGGRDRSGGGLGLAMTKMIVKEHDGQVWAENTESGPMFSFVLPLHRREPTQTMEAMQQTA